MKNLSVALLILLATALGACSSTALTGMPETDIARGSAVSHSSESQRQTLLLVSRNDGSVVMQTISSSADVCFKKTSDSATTCLTQGEPVIDPYSNTIVGYEMIEEHIDLVAKSN